MFGALEGELPALPLPAHTLFAQATRAHKALKKGEMRDHWWGPSKENGLAFLGPVTIQPFSHKISTFTLSGIGFERSIPSVFE